MELCEHLIADFGDGSNGDDGILCGSGGSRSGNASLACLAPLNEALLEFANVLLAPDEREEGLAESDRESVTQALSQSPSPTWLESALESLTGGEAPSHWTIETIWQSAVPWDEALKETSSVIGTMAATSVTFVWAKVPSDGTRQIEEAVAPITADIRAATLRLADLGWRSRAQR